MTIIFIFYSESFLETNIKRQEKRWINLVQSQRDLWQLNFVATKTKQAVRRGIRLQFGVQRVIDPSKLGKTMNDACSWLREYGSSSVIECVQVRRIEIRKRRHVLAKSIISFRTNTAISLNEKQEFEKSVLCTINGTLVQKRKKNCIPRRKLLRWWNKQQRTYYIKMRFFVILCRSKLYCTK